MVICLERGADLHVAKLMSLPLTVSCFSKIQIGFTFLVPADLGSPGRGPLNGCVCYLQYFTGFCSNFICFDLLWILQTCCGLDVVTDRQIEVMDFEHSCSRC